MTNTPSRAANPQMSDDFARVYEAAAHRITVPVAIAALDAVGGIRKGTRVLDIAAGAGALSIPAAERGAAVLGVDIAPGMVRRLAAKLQGYPGCEARVMDGEALDLEDGGFDLSFSIFGAMTFSDWRKGLSEQARVTRPGGKGCVAVWKEPPGGGPFQILLAAMRKVLPDRPAPPWPAGFVALSAPARLVAELEGAGFTGVLVKEIEGAWQGPVGAAYLAQTQELHRYVPSYAALDTATRARVDEAICALTEERASDGQITLLSPVLLAIGTRSAQVRRRIAPTIRTQATICA